MTVSLTQDVAEALRRLPKEVTDARLQRLKRASDLSMKHMYLSEEMQAKQTPFKSYLKVGSHTCISHFLTSSSDRLCWNKLRKRIASVAALASRLKPNARFLRIYRPDLAAAPLQSTDA